MLFANFIFVVSHLKINPADHLKTWKLVKVPGLYKLNRQEFEHNNISCNNNNVLVTISRHIESPSIVSIVRTLFRYFQAYSGATSNILPCSGILRDIKGYWGTFRHYWGVWSHNQKYLELCVTLAYTTMPYSESWLN